MRYQGRQALPVADVERAKAEGFDVIEWTENLVRLLVAPYGVPDRLEWLAQGRDVSGHREEPWATDTPVPAWAGTLLCIGEVERP